ncbi:hypothetical protein ACWEL8_22430 [Streptomyces sp. NPDC004690]
MHDERLSADRFLGEFQELEHGRTDGPVLKECVRSEGEAYEADLVRYLRAGALLAATTSVVHDVLSSGNELIGGLHLLTDGQWFWYTDLAYYVERYHVPVDARFVHHACGRGWRPPQLSDAELIGIADEFFPGHGAAPAVVDGTQ